jgi:hypothetical protein
LSAICFHCGLVGLGCGMKASVAFTQYKPAAHPNPQTFSQSEPCSRLCRRTVQCFHFPECMSLKKRSLASGAIMDAICSW